MVGTALAFSLAFLATSATESLQVRPERYNVYDFGAVGNGTTDDTAAFQNALFAARDAGGGIVFAPRGDYRIAGTLTIPAFVTLEGVFTSPQAWSKNKGTFLLAESGHGNENGTAFITMNSNSTLKGLAIFYPNQAATNAEVPVPYPWCIKANPGDNLCAIDLLLINPYLGINLENGHRHYVARVYGQPLKTGIYINHILDVGRVENVHFWPFGYPYDGNSALFKWQAANGDAFVIGRSDWQFVTNTFCFGYRSGYRFIRTANGVCNGNFQGISADVCQFGIDVEDCWEIGVLITNGQFVGNLEPGSIGMRVGAGNSGTLHLTNCSFWGDQRNVARIEGNGSVTFTACNMLYRWDKLNQGQYAIDCDGGQLTVNGCNFNYDGNDVRVRSRTQEAILYGNRARGGFQVDNQIGNKCQTGLNSRTASMEPTLETR